MSPSAQSSLSGRRNIFDVSTSPAPATVPAVARDASIFARPAAGEHPPDVPRAAGKASSWRRASSPLKRSLAIGVLGTAIAVAAVIALDWAGSPEPSPERIDDPAGRPNLARPRAAEKSPHGNATPPRRTDQPGAPRRPLRPRRARPHSSPANGQPKPAVAPSKPSRPAPPSLSPPVPEPPAPAPAVPPVPRAPEAPGPLPVAPGAPPQFM